MKISQTNLTDSSLLFNGFSLVYERVLEDCKPKEYVQSLYRQRNNEDIEVVYKVRINHPRTKDS